MRPRTALAPVIVLAAGLGFASAAHAATVTPQVACVRVLPSIKTFPLTAAGFPAGASLTFYADGSAFGSGVADGAGNFDNGADPFFAPALPSGRNVKTVDVTVDDGQGTLAGPVGVPVSRVLVTAPSTSKPRRRVRFRVFGFRAGERVYLHVRRNGKTKGRFSMGRTASPCGTLTERMRFMPLRRYRTGTYRYFFSHGRRFRKRSAIYQARVRIYRTARSSQATAAAAWD